jgi:hypothetical protein
VVLNPDDEVTPKAFAAWLDRRQAGEPVDPGISAAETLAEVRALDVGRGGGDATSDAR